MPADPVQMLKTYKVIQLIMKMMKVSEEEATKLYSAILNLLNEETKPPTDAKKTDVN
jgi:transcription initiation factor TFIIIB Brf1 subunit/transcription initiation factor TFIIB